LIAGLLSSAGVLLPHRLEVRLGAVGAPGSTPASGVVFRVGLWGGVACVGVALVLATGGALQARQGGVKRSGEGRTRLPTRPPDSAEAGPAPTDAAATARATAAAPVSYSISAILGALATLFWLVGARGLPGISSAYVPSAAVTARLRLAGADAPLAPLQHIVLYGTLHEYWEARTHSLSLLIGVLAIGLYFVKLGALLAFWCGRGAGNQTEGRPTQLLARPLPLGRSGGASSPRSRSSDRPCSSPPHEPAPARRGAALGVALLLLDLAGKWLAFDYFLVLVSAAAFDTPVRLGADTPPSAGGGAGGDQGGGEGYLTREDSGADGGWGGWISGGPAVPPDVLFLRLQAGTLPGFYLMLAAVGLLHGLGHWARAAHADARAERRDGEGAGMGGARCGGDGEQVGAGHARVGDEGERQGALREREGGGGERLGGERAVGCAGKPGGTEEVLYYPSAGPSRHGSTCGLGAAPADAESHPDFNAPASAAATPLLPPLPHAPPSRPHPPPVRLLRLALPFGLGLAALLLVVSTLAPLVTLRYTGLLGDLRIAQHLSLSLASIGSAAVHSDSLAGPLARHASQALFWALVLVFPVAWMGCVVYLWCTMSTSPVPAQIEDSRSGQTAPLTLSSGQTEPLHLSPSQGASRLACLPAPSSIDGHSSDSTPVPPIRAAAAVLAPSSTHAQPTGAAALLAPCARASRV
jgi:hypothetical protein